MYNPRGLQQYKETDITSMSREKLLVLLYERLINDLQDSITESELGNRLAMTQKLNHANRIISELRIALDHEIGGDIARNLDSIYEYTFSEVLEQLVDLNPIHARNAIKVLDPLLSSWRKIPIGTAEKAERERNQGMNPAQESEKETTAPVLSGSEAKGLEPTTMTGTLSVSA